MGCSFLMNIYDLAAFSKTFHCSISRIGPFLLGSRSCGCFCSDLGVNQERFAQPAEVFKDSSKPRTTADP